MYITHPDGSRTPTGQAVMVTGHRVVRHPDLVYERLVHVLSRLEPSLAVSGGAAGADTLWARAALDHATPLTVVLPNRWYTSKYDAVGDELLSRADVVTAVDRPDVPDWRQRWDAEKWWRDNHARNGVMVSMTTLAIVVSDRAPRTVMREPRGGTASCLRELVRRHGDGTRVIWVPDEASRSVCLDTLRRPI